MTRVPCGGQTCKAEIIWGKTPEGKSIPLDPKPPTYVLGEDGVAVRSAAMVSHFATCPDARQFSGSGRKP
jgi:hypothetical protein